MNVDEETNARREQIWKIAHGRNRSRAAARFDTSDIVQESELQIWRDKLASSKSESEPVDPALVATIAKGTIAKKLRFHNAHKRSVDLEQPLEYEVTSSTMTPDEEMEIHETGNQLLAAINQLCEQERTVIFNRFFRYKTLTQIAEDLELSRQKVKTRYKQAIQSLRKILILDGLI